jgi:hypothetical protein
MLPSVEAPPNTDDKMPPRPSEAAPSVAPPSNEDSSPGNGPAKAPVAADSAPPRIVEISDPKTSVDDPAVAEP